MNRCADEANQSEGSERTWPSNEKAEFVMCESRLRGRLQAVA